MRYRYFCWGVVITSISWAALIMLYTSHLEKVSKQSMQQERNRRRQELGLDHKETKNNPFPHVDLDDKAAWDLPIKHKSVMDRKEMHLKPGKYSIVDDETPNRLDANLGKASKHKGDEALQRSHLDESINNHQGPRPPPRDVDLDQLAIVRTKEDQVHKDTAYSRYAFNGLISDRIGPSRNIPDSRHKLCKAQVYESQLPQASIIICFYNEAPSALTRMLQSIFDRTPQYLIHQILLIDDLSDDPKMMPKVIEEGKRDLAWPSHLIKPIRTDSRMGLIRAKVFGSRIATGEVLVFLDSHCEVNDAWLQPLLWRIKQSPKSVVCPIIDIIDSDTFKYHAAPVCKGGFNWGLFFKWDYPPWTYFREDNDHIKPLASPTMAGGLFAIRKEYFQYLGEYDEGMDVWGAENVEISFRIWMCGGRLEIMPCSRVGHIFRKRRPYGAKGKDTMAINSLRTAHVWLDEYIGKFMQTRPSMKRINYGDISKRIELRQKLKCNSFDWYLRNIYPELLPNDDKSKIIPPVLARATRVDDMPRVVQKIMIRMSGETLCLVSSDATPIRGSFLTLARCDTTDRRQVWHETDAHEMRLMGKLCLDAYKGARIKKCDMQKNYQTWKRTGTKGGQLYNAASGLCLAAEAKGRMGYIVHMDICSQRSGIIWEIAQV